MILVVARPGLAQQSGPETAAQTKAQVVRFEGQLKTAVKEAGERVARDVFAVQQVSQSKVNLQFDAEPVVKGVIIPGVGPVFTVQIPGILPSNIAMLEAWMEFQRPKSAQAQGQAVNNTPEKIGATGIPTADPMGPVPVGAFNPSRAYTNYAREELVNALLDYSGVVPINPGETVAIVAMDMLDSLPVQSRQLGATTTRQLVLSIKADDLLALRQGKITRDEAKQKIVDTRF
jgi:hypothetical protein